ncbi:hypothetical protein AARAC_011769 [Aspergillus arachidicola]|uniref:Subtilisin-like serine protease n=1 Tax=Aspergillus arachidicola TaxID=656916 RepID=A0A2G7GBZ0_9EURO|nr:hypothetical protein AARAC_011769 [Aspergillus arachidicola]
MPASVKIPPFNKLNQLITNKNKGEIPNAPLVSSQWSEVQRFLINELDAAALNDLYPYLIFVATKLWSHIDPLDVHITRGRNIILTENPDLHLIWYYGCLYLKPIPHCLLNFDFWNQYLSGDHRQQQYDVNNLSTSCRSALGFVRSYTRLIRHESDFLLAKDKHLIPKKTKYRDFQIFMNEFSLVPDTAVSPRYHYGQIRLSRLNMAVWLFPPRKWYYYRLDWQIGHYFTRWAPPLLFLWASASLVLSTIQLIHATGRTDSWPAFNTGSRIFAVVALGFIAVLAILTTIGLPMIYGKQLLFAINTMREAWRTSHAESGGNT